MCLSNECDPALSHFSCPFLNETVSWFASSRRGHFEVSLKPGGWNPAARCHLVDDQRSGWFRHLIDSMRSHWEFRDSQLNGVRVHWSRSASAESGLMNRHCWSRMITNSEVLSRIAAAMASVTAVTINDFKVCFLSTNLDHQLDRFLSFESNRLEIGKNESSELVDQLGSMWLRMRIEMRYHLDSSSDSPSITGGLHE